MGPVTRRSVAAPGAAALMGRGGVGAAREAVAGPREGEGAAVAGGGGGGGGGSTTCRASRAPSKAQVHGGSEVGLPTD